jgi:hypothetical protein
MCTVLLSPGGYPIADNKYVYQNISIVGKDFANSEFANLANDGIYCIHIPFQTQNRKQRLVKLKRLQTIG